MKTMLIFLVSFIVVGCNLENPVKDKNFPLIDKREKLQFQTILQTSDLPLFNNDSLITIVLRNKQEELEFLARNPIVQPSRSFPEVNYNIHTVIGILLGVRPYSSFRIQIDSVIDCGTLIRVYSHEYQGIGALDQSGFPVHFIVINKTDLPVVFEEIKVVKEQNSEVHNIFQSWRFLYIENMVTSEKYFPPHEMRTLKITFSTNSRLSGLAPCNSFSGIFQIHSDNRITISQLQTTLMACQLDTLNQWESMYYNALLDVQKYELNPDTLKLFYDQNRKALVYIKL